MDNKTDTATKPSWDDAPDWAWWLAQDRDGKWWWFENAPTLHSEKGFWDTEFGRKECIGTVEIWDNPQYESGRKCRS